MDEHPALALREKKDASILGRLRPGPAAAGGRGVTAGHTGAGMAAAVLRLGRAAAAWTGRPSPSRWSPRRGRFVLLDIGANPDSTGENLLQYAHMGALFAERVLGVRPAARRAPLDRRGEGQGRRPDPARDRAPRRIGPELRGQRRGQGPRPAPGRRGRLRRGRGQRRRSSSSRAWPRSSSTCGGRSSGRGLRGQARLPADAPGHRPDPDDLRLREARRLAAARRAGHGDHHPRPGEAADDRATRWGSARQPRGPGSRS